VPYAAISKGQKLVSVHGLNEPFGCMKTNCSLSNALLQETVLKKRLTKDDGIKLVTA
jgi:hypothetical protein